MTGLAHPRSTSSLLGCAVAVGLVLGSVAVIGGLDAFLACVIGLLLVAAFMLGGRVPLRLGGETTPGLSFALLGLGYALRIVLLLLALRMFRDSGWVDGRVLGGTVILGALVWSLLQVAGHVSSQRPILDLLPSRGAAGPTPLSGGTTSAGRPRGKRVAK